MQVVRDDLRRDREQPLEVRDARPRTSASVSAFLRSPMWCETQARAAAREAERALELGAAREHVARGEATGSASTLGTAPRERRSGSGRPRATRSTESSVRVSIGRSWSRNDVGDAGQPLERVVVLVRDRLVGDVAAGHHQRLADVGEQQVVQRAVGEHHAELGATAARPRRRPARPGRRGASTIGRSRPRSSAASTVAELDQLARRLEVAAPSARTASPRGACAPAAARRRARRPPGRRDGTRRSP